MALLRLMGVFGMDTRPFHSAMGQAETRVVRARGKIGSGISTLVGGIGIRSMLTMVTQLGDTADEIREKFDKVGINISEEEIKRIVEVNNMIEQTGMRLKKAMVSVVDWIYRYVVKPFIDGVELISRMWGAFSAGGLEAMYREVDAVLEDKQKEEEETAKAVEEKMKPEEKDKSRGQAKEDAKILLTGAVRGAGELAAIGGFSQFDAGPNGVQSKQLRELQRITKNTESLKINL
jgi:hypothetical protein